MPRALTEQEIKIKETFILRNAFTLFEENTFKSFRMDDLAKSCGMSKGILFKYFKTKEVLFLKMLEYEYARTYNYLDQLLIRHNEMTKEEFKDLVMVQFAKSLDPTSPLLRLIALKGSVLETNLDYDFAIEHKSRINHMFMELAQNALLKVEGLSLHKIRDIYDAQRIIASGYLNNYIKEGVLKTAIEDANLSMFMVDYKDLAIKMFQEYLKEL